MNLVTWCPELAVFRVVTAEGKEAILSDADFARVFARYPTLQSLIDLCKSNPNTPVQVA